MVKTKHHQSQNKFVFFFHTNGIHLYTILNDMQHAVEGLDNKQDRKGMVFEV